RVVHFDGGDLGVARQVARAAIVNLCQPVGFVAFVSCYLTSFENCDIAPRSGGLDQPQQDRAGGSFRLRPGSARQMKMRPAIARGGEPRMAAKSNGLALLVAAIGVAAIVRLELNQRKQTRRDADATKLDGFG